MKISILKSIEDSIEALEQLKSQENLHFIIRAAEMITHCYKNGNKVLIAGNGGSLCDAMHFAEELTGFFRQQRKALPAIAFSDPGHITCTANDLGFSYVFSRAVEAYGNRDDLFIGLTTSGNSENIVLAIERAKSLGLKTICFLGKNGGKLKGKADLELIIRGFTFSDRIQEAHMTAIHIIIEQMEKLLFTPKTSEQAFVCR